ncbi:MAG: hypothetical protein IJX86_01605 [Lachnospiraceae bacterium]|nr:hypothetical protein [Lachnospiraceae bacterium]MBR3684503.1 hypothetical protein [Lachnospiraceae bacterium]
MAKGTRNSDVSGFEAEKKRLESEKKKLKAEQRNQKKEAKRRAKEIAKQEALLSDEDDNSGSVSTFFVTIIIIVIWLAILCLLVKLDVGGFGSNVLKPILKDVPVINKILPGEVETETQDQTGYYGYTSLKDAVEHIKYLEMQLEQAQNLNDSDAATLAELRAEIARLEEFEENQTEFARIKQEFFEEVVYAANGPGAEEYRKYFEAMDQETAEYLYKMVLIKEQEDAELQDYANAYSSMKPKAAAAIFDTMEDDLERVAKILGLMSAESRGNILAEMNVEIAAKVTKIMDPDS